MYCQEGLVDFSNSQFGLIGVEMSKNYNFNQHDCSRLQIFCNVKKTIMRIAELT